MSGAEASMLLVVVGMFLGLASTYPSDEGFFASHGRPALWVLSVACLMPAFVRLWIVAVLG